MRLHLGGYLNFFSPNRQSDFELKLNGPTPLAEVLKEVTLPAGDVFLAVVNGQLVDLQVAVVGNEDRVELYPPMGGG